MSVNNIRAWVVACSVLALMGTATSLAQVSPEEALRRLREREQNKPKPADPEAATAPAGRWNPVALRSGVYLVEVDGRVYCNTYFNPVYRSKSKRAINRPRIDKSRTKTIKLGYWVKRTPSGGEHKTKYTHNITHELSEQELFARLKAIGGPEPGEFGFVQSAVVDRITEQGAVVFRDVKVVYPDSVNKAYNAARNKLQTSYQGDWPDQRYNLYSVIKRRTSGKKKGSFRRDTPDETVLRDLYQSMIDWEYEGRRVLAQEQRAWNGLSLKLHGVDAVDYHVGQTWQAKDTQLAIVEREGKTVTAVPTGLFGKGLGRERMAELFEHVGLSPDSLDELVRDMNKSRIPGNAVERRFARLLVGNPLKEDRPFADRLDRNLKEAPLASPSTPSLSPVDAIDRALASLVGEQERPFDALLAKRTGQWCREHLEGQSITAEAVLIGADTAPPGKAITPEYTPTREYARGDFRVGSITHRGNKLSIEMIALFEGETGDVLLRLPVYNTKTKHVAHRLTGALADVQVEPDGTVTMVLVNCRVAE